MLQTVPATFYRTTTRTIPTYRVQALDNFARLKHTIFTRHGGVSQVPYHTLNLSSSVGDDPRALRQNLRIVHRSLGIFPGQTASCHLVHGVDVITVRKDNYQPIMGKADSLITDEPDIYLFMRFADCTPLIFFDPVQNAVGLAHAGWRSTMKNVAKATVQAMGQQFDCRPQNIITAIGPAIGPCCYEVGQDVIKAAAESFMDPASLFLYKNGKARFDLWEANWRQLVEVGVTQIIQSDICTSCRTDEFFSHRAENGRTGRFGVIIGLQGYIP